MFGYAGSTLRVSLSDSKIRKEKLDEEEVRKYYGGRGISVKILFEELKPGINPLGYENKLVFATGPLTGAPFSGNVKFAVAAKSPLTGIYGDSMASGFFGPEMKSAGLDALIIEGRSEVPVYLWISDGEIELKNASQLWGMLTGEVVSAIRRREEETAQIACIGPAGEKLVKYACINSTLRNEISAATGRSGMGAVMGSKNLKAIAIKGSRKLVFADQDRLMKNIKRSGDTVMGDFGTRIQNIGTDGGLELLNASGRLPIKNFSYGTFIGAEKITGRTISNTILIKRNHCYACKVGCKRVVKIDKGPYRVDPLYGGPEYETCAAFGSYCMNDNLASIAKANELCNKYSIDTISAGVCIAFLMECYEKKLVDKDECDGLDLSWGNHQSIVSLVEKIALREGIGNLLAEGVKRAALQIGKESEQYAMHVKGLELPMHEPHGKKGVGLSYATSIRGGCHMQCPHDDLWGEGESIPELGVNPIADRLNTGPMKSKLVVLGQNWWSACKSLSICAFTQIPWGIPVSTLVDLISSVTGWEVTPNELMQVGERAWNLARAFNVREGITRDDDVLPDRFGEPLPAGLYKGESIPKKVIEKMKDYYYYYEYREWKKSTGIPTKEKLDKLGLQHVSNELKKLGKFY